MKTVSVVEAKSHFSALLAEVFRNLWAEDAEDIDLVAPADAPAEDVAALN